MKRLLSVCFLGLLCASASAAPIRYVSQRSDTAYLREGPSFQHKILWVYKRKGYPFQVVASYDVWRRVKAADGTVGWMSANMLTDQRSLSLAGDADMTANLDTVKELGYRSLDALRAGRTGEFADLMHEHWLHKRKRSGGMSNPRIDRLYDLALDNGARGGKLVGAGGGGFLMFYAEDTRSLRSTMKAEGLHELKFGFDHQGSTVLVQD